MRQLVIECATQACSAALFDGEMLVEGRFELIDRGHAERLVPMIAELPDKGRAVRIIVSLGPGSFTGVRIGLAAARALGLAWGAQVLGYPTLALIAAMARADHPALPVTVCMSGGHGEWFVQDFAAEGLPEGAARSLAPDAAATRLMLTAGRRVIAGNQAEALGELLNGSDPVLALLPDARQAHQINAALLTPHLAPIYGRAPDARLPGARA